MKTAILFLAAAYCTWTSASPNGVYHQQYNFKTSSASFKNNELQHKVDDQGYYQREGDLEGRVKPKVSANSEHSEYVNPNANAAYTDGGSYYGGGNQELSSYGNLVARGSYGGASSNLHQGLGSGSYGSGYSQQLASSDRIAGDSAGSYGSYSGYGSYGSSSSHSSLNSVASNVQSDLQHEMEASLRRLNAYHNSIDTIEEELRRNLTERFNQALTEQYGQQSIRGGQSYSIQNGRLQTVPNYQQQELQNLQRQVENSLLSSLRREWNQRVSHESSYNSDNYVHYEKTTLRPVVYPQPSPQRIAYHYEPIRITAPSTPAPHHYHQSQTAESITTIGSKVQNNLDNELNRLLSMIGSQSVHENQYFTLERLQNDLRQNISSLLDQELRRQFGSQVQRDGFMFTNGQHDDYNYKLEDVENIRKQVEQNLIRKLNREYQNYYARSQSAHYQGSQSYSSESGYQGAAGYQGATGYQGVRGDQGGVGNQGESGYYGNRIDYDTTTPSRYLEYYQSTRPTAASIVPLVENGLHEDSYGSSSNYAGRSSYSSGTGYSGGSQSGYSVSSSQQMAELQRQLESQLSSQLQQAINQNRRHSSQYESQGYNNLQTYDTSLKQLTEELNRNLTRQLQEYMQGGSYSSSYGGGFNQNQLDSLRSQLQRDLFSQLQQGLTQAYSASASYSASSSHSSSGGGGYRSARGSENYSNGGYGYGQRNSGQYSSYSGADCDE